MDLQFAFPPALEFPSYNMAILSQRVNRLCDARVQMCTLSFATSMPAVRHADQIGSRRPSFWLWPASWLVTPMECFPHMPYIFPGRTMFLHNSGGGQASEKHLHLRSVHEFFLVTRCRSSEWIAVKEPE